MEEKSIEDLQKDLKKIDERILSAYNGGMSEQVINTLQFYKEELENRINDQKIIEENEKSINESTSSVY